MPRKLVPWFTVPQTFCFSEAFSGNRSQAPLDLLQVSKEKLYTCSWANSARERRLLLFQVRHAYELVPESESRPVDVLLVNTCGFIGDAKEQSIQTILACVARKKAGEVGRRNILIGDNQRVLDLVGQLTQAASQDNAHQRFPPMTDTATTMG